MTVRESARSTAPMAVIRLKPDLESMLISAHSVITIIKTAGTMMTPSALMPQGDKAKKNRAARR